MLQKTIKNLGQDINVTIVKEAKNSPLIDDHAWSPGMDKVIYERVENMVNSIEKGREAAVLEFAEKLLVF